jgi:hypothetical protein
MDYDATHSLGDAGQQMKAPTGAQFSGALDLTYTRATGEWRYLDIYAGGIDVNTGSLAVEVNWTTPGTVMDAYLVNYNGSVIVDSNPVFVADGTWASYPSAPPTTTRLVADIDGYHNQTMGKYFTLALHAVMVNTTSSPFTTFKVGAAYLDAAADDFENTPTFVRTGTDNLADGTQVTAKDAGIMWSPASGGNPIPRFTPEGLHTTLGINAFTAFTDSGDVTSPATDGGAWINLVYSAEVFLTEGMSVVAILEWDDGSDLDMVLVPKGTAPDYNNDISGNSAATGANPETLTAEITATGTYVIAFEYYDGDNSDFHWDLDFKAFAAVADTSSDSSSTISLDLVAGKVADATYLLTSSSSGWNGGESTSFAFVKNADGPLWAENEQLPETLGTTVALGAVYDAVNFSITIKKGTTEVFDGDFGPGNHEVSIASSHIVGFNEDNEFTYTAEDQFGKTSSGTFTVFRGDVTTPVISGKPADLEAKTKEDVTISWTVVDSSGGTFKILIGGVEQTALGGTWAPGTVSVTTSFDTAGEYFMKIELFDKGGNSDSDTVKITVTKKKSKDSGFLPFNFTFMLVAIPVLVALKKKSSVIKNKVIN